MTEAEQLHIARKKADVLRFVILMQSECGDFMRSLAQSELASDQARRSSPLVLTNDRGEMVKGDGRSQDMQAAKALNDAARRSMSNILLAAQGLIDIHKPSAPSPVA